MHVLNYYISRKHIFSKNVCNNYEFHNISSIKQQPSNSQHKYNLTNQF